MIYQVSSSHLGKPFSQTCNKPATNLQQTIIRDDCPNPDGEARSLMGFSLHWGHQLCRPSETVSVKMARTWFHETVRTPTKKFKLRRLSQPHRHLKGGALIKAFQFKRSLMGRFLLEEQLHLHPSPCPAHRGPDREVRFAGLLYWVKPGYIWGTLGYSPVVLLKIYWLQ